jgi:malic enzyme
MLVEKDPTESEFVINGVGAAGIAIAKIVTVVFLYTNLRHTM